MMNKATKRRAKRTKFRFVYAIWDNDAHDYVRELPSNVDDGGEAILMFTSRRDARERAAKHWGCLTYRELWATGNGQVIEFGIDQLQETPK
jgi:hypothetical protein